MSTFGERFSRVLQDIARGPDHLDQQGVAVAVGKKPAVISGYKAGRSKPSWDVLFVLRKRFGVSIDALLDDDPLERLPGVISLDDPWIKNHRAFLSDCRDMHPGQFDNQARAIHFFAEEERQRQREQKERDDRSLADIDSDIKTLMAEGKSLGADDK